MGMPDTYQDCQLCRGRGWLRFHPCCTWRGNGGTRTCWACRGVGLVLDFESCRQHTTRMFVAGDVYFVHPIKLGPWSYRGLAQVEREQLVDWKNWLHSIGLERARELYG